MTIIEAIRAAVEAGRLQEPFTVADLAAVLEGFQYGSLQAALSRYSRPGPGQAEAPLSRVERGKYCLARPDRKAQSVLDTK